MGVHMGVLKKPFIWCSHLHLQDKSLMNCEQGNVLSHVIAANTMLLRTVPNARVRDVSPRCFTPSAALTECLKKKLKKN